MKPGKRARAGLVAIMMVVPNGVWKAESTAGRRVRVVVRGPTSRSTSAGVDAAATPSLASARERARARQRVMSRHPAVTRTTPSPAE